MLAQLYQLKTVMTAESFMEILNTGEYHLASDSRCDF